MEVHSLVVHITESDLTALTAKALPPDAPLENVVVSIRPEGVCVKGVYPMIVNVAFECWWELAIDSGKVAANLTRMKALGMPATIFKSAVLRVLESVAAKHKWIEVRGEHIHVDTDALLSRGGCPARLNLRSIRCGDGNLVVESAR